MTLRAVAAGLLTLILAAATPRPVIVVSDPGPVHPVDEQRWRTGAPQKAISAGGVVDTVESSSPVSTVPSSGAPPHLIPPTCSGPCPTLTPRPRATVSGIATWYRWHSGEAAAGPALRVGHWRGRVVRVCAGVRCVVVRLSDYCQCGHGRVIDLDVRSFARLAPPSRGVLTVTVAW